MKLNTTNNKKFFTLLFLGFIISANSLFFIDFGYGDCQDCCSSGCHCSPGNECEMTIDCGETHVVLLVPILDVQEKENENLKLDNNHSNISQENKYSNINLKSCSDSKIIHNPPFSKINTPLLI